MLHSKIFAVVAAALLVCVETATAGLPLCVANRCPKKRAVFGDIGKNDLLPRQADPYATIYPLTPIPFWAALPFSSCGGTTTVGGIATKTICPLEFYCHCHSGSSRLCLPTSTVGPASITTCSPYSGVTTCSQCEFYWQTTLTNMATAYQQCGGYSDGIITQAWDVQTLCPVNYRCNPLNFWYSQCIPVTASQTPISPMQYWACASQSYSYATAQGDRCGGHCFKANGKVDGICPNGMKCWTKTYTNPGYDAFCYSTTPTPTSLWRTNLCYPIPYDFVATSAPVCTPQTGATQTPYGQCYGATVNAAGSSVSWTGPSNCPCGYQCTTYNPSYGICNNIPNLPTSACNTVGAGTQTLYGRCGGSTYVNGSVSSWNSPTLCPAGASCVTDDGGWYAQCRPVAKNRRRSPSPAAAPAPLPVANAAALPTAAAEFAEKYEGARPASKPRYL
ncbi:hypothetical protein TWF132_000995 [Orbilia oligospora]|nr:hypothetical protein TWF132_000995 [Orbilia oligospora]